MAARSAAYSGRPAHSPSARAASPRRRGCPSRQCRPWASAPATGRGGKGRRCYRGQSRATL
eukprot:13048082-Alexandrium_andersonii.AAC.1